MFLLKRITYGETYGADAGQYRSVRVVLLDEDNLVAVLHVGSVDFYTLPGGGIDEGETPQQAAVREVCEETGCDSEIMCALGVIEENSKACEWNGINTCFMSRVKGSKGVQRLTQIESDEDTRVHWYSIHEALDIIANQRISGRDEREMGIGKIIGERDVALLNKAVEVLGNRHQPLTAASIAEPVHTAAPPGASVYNSSTYVTIPEAAP
jgi:8-oxo-dGTP pyrophosphatase MutT (NUDIX family)